MGTFYRRHLPHWEPNGAVLFVTYRLFGSLPILVMDRLRLERERLRKVPPSPNESPRDRALREGKRLFGLLDDALGEEAANPRSPCSSWLADHRIAALIRRSLFYYDGDRYRLHRYVIMPNHVHVILAPLELPPGTEAVQCAEDKEEQNWKLRNIMHGLKSYTAKEANRILGRSGVFWQDESFDHWIRDPEEYAKISDYMDQNPVKAGLCQAPGEWRWSSAGEGIEPLPR